MGYKDNTKEKGDVLSVMSLSLALVSSTSTAWLQALHTVFTYLFYLHNYLHNYHKENCTLPILCGI